MGLASTEYSQPIHHFFCGETLLGGGNFPQNMWCRVHCEISQVQSILSVLSGVCGKLATWPLLVYVSKHRSSVVLQTAVTVAQLVGCSKFTHFCRTEHVNVSNVEMSLPVAVHLKNIYPKQELTPLPGNVLTVVTPDTAQRLSVALKTTPQRVPKNEANHDTTPTQAVNCILSAAYNCSVYFVQHYIDAANWVACVVVRWQWFLSNYLRKSQEGRHTTKTGIHSGKKHVSHKNTKHRQQATYKQGPGALLPLPY